MKNLIITILCLGFFITFNNDSNQKMYYWLYWVDHPYDYLGPVNLAGGELEPLELYKISNKYKAGKYIVSWASVSKIDKFESEYGFIADKDMKSIIIKPGGVE